MRKLVAFLLSIAVAMSMSIVACAADTEDLGAQELEEKLKSGAFATITDSEGNVEKILNVEVNVQRQQGTRSVFGNRWVVTYTARDTNNHSDSGSKDGVTATATITSNDVFGMDNILISVSGGWSGDGVRDAEDATSSRTVSYEARSFSNVLQNSGNAKNVGTSFYYTPYDFTGFTFILKTSAKITATGRWLNLYATTDS